MAGADLGNQNREIRTLKLEYILLWHRTMLKSQHSLTGFLLVLGLGRSINLGTEPSGALLDDDFNARRCAARHGISLQPESVECRGFTSAVHRRDRCQPCAVPGWKCETPRQMNLANALCRYLEVARGI